MKTKKIKPENKKITKKINPPPLMFFDKTVVTTKEKTHATIEENIQNCETKLLLKSPKNSLIRTSSYAQKMTACDLSPFSNDDEQSFEKERNTFSPRLKKESLRKSEKKVVALKKKKVPKVQTKLSKEESNQFAYENLLLRKMNEKKITELSEESQISIKEGTNNKMESKSKMQVVKDMLENIERNLKKTHNSGYSSSQRKFLRVVILIQRLWRQRRAKKIINAFIFPNAQQTQSLWTEKSHNISKNSLNDQGGELQKKSLIETNEKELTNLKIYSPVRETPIELNQAANSEVDLEDFKIREEDCEVNRFEKQRNLYKFVECYRNISIQSHKKSHHQSKNVFNTITSSLSEKCILQKYYSKLVDSSEKGLLFSNQEKSRDLIFNFKSPQKNQIVELEERFYTELQEDEHPVENKQIQPTSIQPTNLEVPSQDQFSLKSIQHLAEQLIQELMVQFSQEFQEFASRSCLQKKKKNRLPGIAITEESAHTYLVGIVNLLFAQNSKELVNKFGRMNSLSFLKLQHSYDDDSYFEEKEDELDLPIVPNSIFYQYQSEYEATVFTISEENLKYKNFIEGLIRIYNLALFNSLSEKLEKQRIDQMKHPWDFSFHRKPLSFRPSPKQIRTEIELIIQDIGKNSMMKIGQLHKKIDSDCKEEQKLLKSIRDEYQVEGKEWVNQDQFLELRLEITDYIELLLFQEVVEEVGLIFF